MDEVNSESGAATTETGGAGNTVGDEGTAPLGIVVGPVSVYTELGCRSTADILEVVLPDGEVKVGTIGDKVRGIPLYPTTGAPLEPNAGVCSSPSVHGMVVLICPEVAACSPSGVCERVGPTGWRGEVATLIAPASGVVCSSGGSALFSFACSKATSALSSSISNCFASLIPSTSEILALLLPVQITRVSFQHQQR